MFFKIIHSIETNKNTSISKFEMHYPTAPMIVLHPEKKKELHML